MNNASPAEKMTKFKAFIELWLGPHDKSYGVPEEELEPLNLPKPLSDFYSFLGRWPDQPFRNLNYLIDPKDMSEEKLKKNYGLIEFATENQGVYRWATVADDSDDPDIYSSENFERIEAHDSWDYTYEPYPGWDEQGQKLSDFLIDFILQELLYRSSAPMPPKFKSYIDSKECKKEILSYQVDTDKPRFVLIDNDYLVFDGDGHGWDSLAARSDTAEKALTAFNSEKSEVLSIFVIFGPSIPKESFTNNPWQLTIKQDGSGIIGTGPCYFNTGKFKPATFDFQEILKNIKPAKRERLGPGATFKTTNEKTDGSITPEYMKTLFLELIEAIEEVDTLYTHPESDVLKAHPPEYIDLKPVISHRLQQKMPQNPYYQSN